MPLLPIFRKSPFARLLIFYTAGIFATQCIQGCSRGVFLILAGLLAALLAILVCTLNRHRSYFTLWITGMLFGVVLFLVGFMNMDIRYNVVHTIMQQRPTQGIYILHITGIPEISENYVRTTARMISGHEKPGPLIRHGKILTYLEMDSLSLQLKPGDRIMANTTIKPVTSTGNPDEFNYRKYLAARKIYKQTYLGTGSWRPMQSEIRNYPGALANKLLGNLLHTYRQIGLDKNQFGILAAMTLGYRNDLEAHTKQAFSRAGVMHVMALSGFNVAVIALALGFVLGVFDGSRIAKVIKTVVTVIVIWVFALVTGFSASVVRAAAMISLVLFGKLVNRQINTINMLFATAFMILTCSPGLLADVSFQLSFTAVWGIVLYQPVFYRFMKCKYKLTDSIWKLFTVSCAAQLATLPLTLYYFHQFPVYFWLTNLYVVPLVSLIIIVSGVYLLVSFFPPLAIMVGKLLSLLLQGLYKSVLLPEILPFAIVGDISINVAQTLLLFIMILLLVLFFIRKRSFLVTLSLMMLLVIQLISTIHHVQTINQRILLVANLKGSTVVNLVGGRAGVLCCDSSLAMHDRRINYVLTNFWISHGVSGRIYSLRDFKSPGSGCQVPGLSSCVSPWLGNNTLLKFEGQRIILLHDNRIYGFHAEKRLKVTLVILSGKVTPDLQGITRMLEPELLILDSSVNQQQASQWKKACEQMQIPYWSVADKGAYQESFR